MASWAPDTRIVPTQALAGSRRAAGSTEALLLGLPLWCVATVVGLVLLWPDDDRVADVTGDAAYAAPGVTFPRATVTEAQPACAPGDVGGRAGDGAAAGEDDACGRLW